MELDLTGSSTTNDLKEANRVDTSKFRKASDFARIKK